MTLQGRRARAGSARQPAGVFQRGVDLQSNHAVGDQPPIPHLRQTFR